MRLFVLHLVLLLSAPIYAQQKCVVSGQCRDANTREPLEFVQVVLGEGAAHTATN